MTKTKQTWRLAKLPLAVSLASTLAAPAFGVTFNIGEIEGQLDSSLSVGASWSTSKADKNLIGANNGGKGLSQTSDDSHLNFKRGETFSKIFKGIHDLELKYGDTGVFVRGKYWYDFELKDEQRLWKDIDDSNRKQGAQSSGAEILDAFALVVAGQRQQRLGGLGELGVEQFIDLVVGVDVAEHHGHQPGCRDAAEQQSQQPPAQREPGGGHFGMV